MRVDLKKRIDEKYNQLVAPIKVVEEVVPIIQQRKLRPKQKFKFTDEHKIALLIIGLILTPLESAIATYFINHSDLYESQKALLFGLSLAVPLGFLVPNLMLKLKMI